MHPHPSPMLGSPLGARLVGANDSTLTGALKTIVLPGSPQVGDLCLMFVDYADVNTNSLSGGAGGWNFDTYTWTSLGYYSNVFHKRLASADLVASALKFLTTQADGTLSIAIYRGPKSATLKQTLQSGAANPSLSGITKVSCAGFVAHITSRDPSITQTPPARFTARNDEVTAVFRTGLADLLNPSDHANGDPFTWTTATPANPQVLHLYELRS